MPALVLEPERVPELVLVLELGLELELEPEPGLGPEPEPEPELVPVLGPVPEQQLTVEHANADVENCDGTRRLAVVEVAAVAETVVVPAAVVAAVEPVVVAVAAGPNAGISPPFPHFLYAENWNWTRRPFDDE